MNIQKIFVGQIRQLYIKTNNNDRYSYDGIKMKEPLKCDTVTFHARVKKTIAPELKAAIARKEARTLRDIRQIAEAKKEASKTAPTKKSLDGEERTWGVSLSIARKIQNKIKKPQEQIHDFLNNIFGDLLVSELNPKNLLLEMSDRPKSAISIMEKSATRKFNTQKEILDGMTDLNGGKTVMNYKTGKVESEMVLSRYIPLIKTGQVRLREIELQRPEAIKHLSQKEQEEYDYVSKEFLDRLEDAQEEVINKLENDADKIILIDRPLPKYTKGNYCALHLLFELIDNGSKVLYEHQHMGARVAKGKSLDDKRFKFFDGKQLDKIYSSLAELWLPLKEAENAEAKERYVKYYKDANLQLRKDEIQENKTQRLINRGGNLYITVRDYNLTPEYDLNTQYKIMQDAENKSRREARKKVQKTPVKIVLSPINPIKVKAPEPKIKNRKQHKKNNI